MSLTQKIDSYGYGMVSMVWYGKYGMVYYRLADTSQ